MAAIILSWDPERWNLWNYPEAVHQVGATGLSVKLWDAGPGRSIPAGTEAWLLLRGRRGPGLIGHGVVAGAHRGPDRPEADRPEADRPGTDRPDTDRPAADRGRCGGSRAASRGAAELMIVAFDVLLPLGDQIGIDETGVGQTVLDVFSGPAAAAHQDGTHGPALDIGPSEEAKIRALWTGAGPAPAPDPTKPVPGTYPERAISRVPVNRYEQDAAARRACIAHHGTSCAACGFSFEVTYGAIGRDFVDVHHIVPAARLGSDYELDPVTDLVPLCANCHAMVHRGVGVPRTVAELRRLTAAAGFLAGATVTSEELEAEREARRILGS